MAADEARADVMAHVELDTLRSAAMTALRLSRESSAKTGKDIQVVITATGGIAHPDFRNVTIEVKNKHGGIIYTETIR